MISALTLDYAVKFSADHAIVLDVSGWDYVVAHFVGTSGTITIQSSNDGGAKSDPSTAQNFATIVGTKMADGTTVSSVAADGLFKVSNMGRYLKFGGSGASATTLLIEYQKVC